VGSRGNVVRRRVRETPHIGTGTWTTTTWCGHPAHAPKRVTPALFFGFHITLIRTDKPSSRGTISCSKSAQARLSCCERRKDLHASFWERDALTPRHSLLRLKRIAPEANARSLSRLFLSPHLEFFPLPPDLAESCVGPGEPVDVVLIRPPHFGRALVFGGHGLRRDSSISSNNSGCYRASRSAIAVAGIAHTFFICSAPCRSRSGAPTIIARIGLHIPSESSLQSRPSSSVRPSVRPSVSHPIRT